MDISTGLGVIGPIQRVVFAEPGPPASLGFLPDLTLQRDVEMPAANLASDFTGPGLTFELAPQSDALPSGFALSTSGVLSGTPTAATGALNIVIQAVNAQGSATSGFSLIVVDMLLDFDTSIAGLSLNATYGPSAMSGVALTADASGFTGAAPASVSYQWKTVESGALFGATAAVFTPDAGLYDGEQLYCTITPQGYPAKDTAVAVIRYPAPLPAGSPGEQFWDVGTDAQTIDMAPFVTGEALSWSVAAQGGSITPATGQLSIRTDSQAIGATARVRAVNSGGVAEVVFLFNVEDIAAGPGPDLATPILDDASNSIGLLLDEPATVYWRRDPVGFNPDPADVISGGGFDSGSQAVGAGASTFGVDFAAGNDGPQNISFVAASLVNEPSLVRTTEIDIDAEALLLGSSQPPAGTTNVSLDIAPILTFNKTIVAGVGTVTLFDVTGSTPSEVFDVSTDVGSAAGQITFSDTNVTLTPSGPLISGREYAVLIDDGAITDLAGNAFSGISSTTEMSFITDGGSLFDLDFGAGFTTNDAALWSSLQTNSFNVTVDHRPSENWASYPPGLTAGGVVGVKSGSYPQLRFSLPVDVGKTYTIDADLLVGEGSWNGALRAKIGSAINQSDYAQIDESEAGQPRVVQVRGLTFTASTSQLWFAIIVQTSTSGSIGGQPAISMLRIQEV